MSSQKKKQVADRESVIHEEMTKFDLYEDLKELVYTVSHDVNKRIISEDNKSLDAVRLKLLSEQQVDEAPIVNLERIPFLKSEFFDVFSFLRCWHPYRKSPIEQHNLFHVPSATPEHQSSHLFWKTEPDTTSSLDFFLYCAAPSETSDHGAKLVDLVISLLKCVFKRRQIDILNWETHFKQWVQQIFQAGHVINLPQDSPFQQHPVSSTFMSVIKELKKFKEFAPRAYVPPNQPRQQFQPIPVNQHQQQVIHQQQMMQQLHGEHVHTQAPLTEFSFFGSSFALRVLLLAALVENAFASNFDAYKNAADKYHAEYMRFEPIWSPSVSAIGVVGSFYWLYDECLWYMSTDNKWYLICHNLEEWEQFLEMPIIADHPSLAPAIKKCKETIEEDYLIHLEMLASQNPMPDTPETKLFATHRCLQIAEFRIQEAYKQQQQLFQDSINAKQRDVVEQQRIQQEADQKIKSELLQKEHAFNLKLQAFNIDPVNVAIKQEYYKRPASPDFSNGKFEFIELDQFKFSKSLEEIPMTLRTSHVALSIVKELLASEFGWPFEEPVDPVELDLPDYFDVIKTPMDCSTILCNILDNKYTTFHQFHEHVILMFQNAHEYNDPDSEIVNVTHELELLYVQCLCAHGFPLVTEGLDVPRRRKIHKPKAEEFPDDVDEELLNEIDEELETLQPARKKKKRNEESSEEFEMDKVSSVSSKSVSSSFEADELALEEESVEEHHPQQKQQQHAPQPMNQQQQLQMQQQQQAQYAMLQAAHVQAYLRCLYDFVEALSKSEDQDDLSYLVKQKAHYADTWQKAKTNGQLDIKVTPHHYQQQMIRVVVAFQGKLEPQYLKFLQPQIEKVNQFQQKYKMQMEQQHRQRQMNQQQIVQQQQQQMMYMQQYPQNTMHQPRPYYPQPQQQHIAQAQQHQVQHVLQNDPLIQHVQMGFGQQHSISPSKVLGSFENNGKEDKKEKTT